MSGINITTPSSSGSGGTGLETPVAASLVIDSGETTTDFNITAGKMSVVIENVGPVGGGAAATATVNGDPLFPGRTLKLEAIWDPAAGEFLKIPALTIVTNSATIWYHTTE